MEKEGPAPLHSRDKDTSAAAPTPTIMLSSEQQQQQRPRPHLCIDIPAAAASSTLPADHVVPTPTPTPTPSSRRGQQLTVSSSNIPSTPSSARPAPPLRSRSFMLRQTVRSLLPPAGSFKSPSSAISKLFSFSSGTTNSKTTNKVMARTSSLPVPVPPLEKENDAAALSLSSQPQPTPPTDHQQKQAAAAAVHHMCRSQSLPMSMKKLNNTNAKSSFKRMDSVGGGMFRVVPSTPRTPAGVVPDIAPEAAASGGDGDHEDDDGEEGEDIAEEEAVCRICMVELSESEGGGSDEGGVMKLECRCKGDLALAHTDCALRWFSIKGTRTCEVCKHDVQNLPVTLLRLQSTHHRDGSQLLSNRGNPHHRYRVWHGTPILVIISILAYFCFLEELLVAHEGIAALAISLPFSCILGLFSSLTTTSMVARRYVWIYAAVQFLLVVFFTHLFYRYLHMQAVISIILATFAGFGVGMTGNSIVVEILRWRARRMAPPTQQRHRRARAPRQQQPPPASDDSDQPSSQPSAAADLGMGVGVGQHNAMATAGDVENPPVLLPHA